MYDFCTSRIVLVYLSAASLSIFDPVLEVIDSSKNVNGLVDCVFLLRQENFSPVTTSERLLYVDRDLSFSRRLVRRWLGCSAIAEDRRHLQITSSVKVNPFSDKRTIQLARSEVRLHQLQYVPHAA